MIGLAVAWFSASSGEIKEPEYAGKSLSEWLGTAVSDKESAEARKAAVLHMGTNSLPSLIQAIRSAPLNLDDPNWPQQVPAWQRNATMHWNAMEAFAVLGHQAAPAIPELLRLSKVATNDYERRAVIDALGYLQEDGLLALMTIVADQSHLERCHAIATIGAEHRGLGTNIMLAVPLLLKCLQEKDSNIVSSAVQSLGDLRLEPQTVVPALTNLMRSPDALVRESVLSAFEHWLEAGALYAPALVTALSDSSEDVRSYATNVLMSSPGAIRVVGTMGEAARPAVPVLIKALANGEAGVDAAKALARLPFDPGLAIPALKDRVREFRTPVAVASADALANYGTKAGWAAPELIEAMADSRIEVRIAATNALLKIAPYTLQAGAITNSTVKNANPGIFRF